MIMENSTKGILKKWHALVAIFFLAAFATNVQAQNVTIGPDNGSLITGQAGGNTGDSGIGRGMASMWRHEQLALTMTTSDIANLTGAGELADPSCAIDVYNGNLIIGAGQTQTFVVVSLPKGYRITGYRLVLQPNITGTITLHPGKNSWSIGTDDTMCFYETPAWSKGNPYIRPGATTGNASNTHYNITNLDDHNYEYYAVATAADGSTLMQNNNATNQAKEFVITRTSKTPSDMSNQLHFWMGASGENRDSPYQYAVTIKHFEITFTAEGTFDAEVMPAKPGEAVSVVRSPFSTSKMDVGAIELKDGVYTYDYTGVRDLIAYTWLYQEDAINGGKPSEGVAENKHIYPLELDGKGAFAFGEGTFFIEPPTTIETASAWESPIGFRVVGATFNYDWGTATEGGTISIANGYRISGGNGYYLNDNLDFVQSTQANAFVWQMDEFGNLYTGDDYKRYLSCFGTGTQRILSLGSAASGHEATWNLRVASDGRVYYLSDGGNYYYLNYVSIQEGGTTHRRGYVTQNANSDLATATAINGTYTVDLPSFTPGKYTIEVYGTNKTTPVFTKTVSSAADKGTYELENINNDAVMFKIKDVATGCQALVNVTLQLEALNPYINSMNIVCQSENVGGKQLEIIQPFTANDFKVSGGKFIFYIPTDYSNSDLTFSFRDLSSDYGDASYGGEGNARYSYVTSPYFQEFDGVANNAASGADASGDAGLYDNRYNPNTASTDKIYTLRAGNIRFEFNNAEELTGTGSTQTLKEYQFSVSKYLGSDDPDGTDKKGEFKEIVMNASKENQKSGIYFVFTADETRYNIAPTTALEHRSYAFYRMDIELVAKNYVPGFDWTKVYDATCYADVENGKTIDAEKPMWGLKLLAYDTDDDGEPLSEPVKGGYLSVKEILDAFNGVSTQLVVGSTIGGSNAPESADQILYVDGSDLRTIVASAGDYSLESFKENLAPNALVYLPENMTSTADNFAYKTGSGAFNAGGNIVLTDRKPFFAPYDIQVGAAKYAQYTREAVFKEDENNNYKRTAYQSVILPFDVLLSTTDLKFTRMTGSMSDAEDAGTGSIVQATFGAISGQSAVANQPYMVQATSSGTDDNIFTIKQTGAKVLATPTATNYKDDYTLWGEEVTTSYHDGNLDFQNMGSYSGKKIDKKADSNTYFYYASGFFRSTADLVRPYLYIYPFRAYYSVSGTGLSKLTSFMALFNDSEVTGIKDIKRKIDFAIQTGKGFVTVTSAVDKNVRIHALNGVTMANMNLNAGTSQTVALPAGVYVVNGMKIIVK